MDALDILLDLLARNGDIPAAFHAYHADIGADTENLHAVLAARVIFLHFEDVTDIKSLDFHKNSFLEIEYEGYFF